MKIDDKHVCNIVRDLLPLYADNACTEESKNIVEEHIKECSFCARTLDAMKAPVEITNSRNMALEPTEFKSIKALKRASRKAKIKTAIIIVLIIILLAPLGVLTVNQYNGKGRCFTNFDDIDACTEFMNRWVNSGFEAVLDEMEPMGIYEDIIRKKAGYHNNPYEDYYAIDVNGTICYFNGQDEFYTAKELILDDEEFMNDFWYSVIVSTIWDYVIPADIYESMETKYGEDFYKSDVRKSQFFDFGVPRKISTKLGDYYYNYTTEDDYDYLTYDTADFSEKVEESHPLDTLYYIIDGAKILTPELYDYYCKVYDERCKWDKKYREYYENLGYDGFKTEWKNKVFEYMADYEKQGIILVDYEYDDAYLNFFTYGIWPHWEISFNVTFSNGAQGYVTISRDNDKYCLISSDVDKTESFKNQRFFNQLWFAVWGRYYVEESYERF